MLNAVRIVNIASELKRHTDNACVNDGDYQVMMDHDEPMLLVVSVFDCRDLEPLAARRPMKTSRYNIQRVGWSNQLFMWLRDIDAVWELEGSLRGEDLERTIRGGW